MNQFSYTIPVVSGHITGRNGTYDLTAIKVWGSDNGVWFDGIGKRKTVINGGIRIDREAFNELLKAMGVS